MSAAFVLSVLLTPLIQDPALSELPSRVAFDCSGESQALERLFVVPLPTDGRLHLCARSASADPRLVVVQFEEAGEPAVFRDDSSGGGTSAYLELDGAGGDTLEVLVAIAAPAAGAARECVVELVSSLARETDQSLMLADELLAELSAVDLQAADAPQNIARLAARLPADAAEISPSLCVAAERFTALPRHVRTPEVDVAARTLLHSYAVRHLPRLYARRIDAATWLAAAWKESGRLAEARELELEILDARRALAPEGHRSVQIARLNLAATHYLLGDLERAALEFRVLTAGAEGGLAPGDPLLSAARQNLAAVELERGYADEAEELYATVIDSLTPGVPENDLGLAAARANHARALLALGRPEEAEPLFARALEALRAGLPPSDPQLIACELDQGQAMAQLGDLQGTLVIYERVLEDQLARHSADHPDVVRTLQSLAGIRFELGDPHAALALYDEVIAQRERLGPAGDQELLFARLFRAATLRDLGELDRALADLEAVVADLPADLGRGHPLVSAAHTNLSGALSERGDLDRARPLQEAVLADQLALLPETNPDVQRARNNLAWTLVRQGRLQETAALLSASTRALEERLAQLAPGRGAREIEGIVSRSRIDVDEALSIVGGMPAGELRDGLEARLFHLVESVRAVGLAQRRAQRLYDEAPGDPGLRAAAADLRAAQAEVVRRSRVGDEGIFDAVRRRDAAQRGLLSAMGSTDREKRLDLDELASALGSQRAAVGYWRYQRKTWDPETLHLSAPESHYLAYVVRSAGLVRVELGSAAVIDAQIEQWRALVASGSPGSSGSPESPERGVTLTISPGTPEAELIRAGGALRALLLDPFRAALGEASTLHCAPDDALAMVPFDALPDGSEAVLGDSLGFVYCSGLTRLESGSDRATAPTLLAMGGIAYESPARPPRSLVRSAWQPGFSYLPGSEAEVRVLEQTFASAFPDAEALVLTGAQASRATFESAAPEATFLHLATHAYFAPESIPSMRDDALLRGDEPSLRGPREQVRGFAPMLLCGLAFAGAGRAESADEALPSLLTAEELATLDLSGCELAVLSACDTSVGVRRAGQGVASLQTALHAAGVRNSIAALWAVPDTATKELMGHFYRALWIEGKTEAEALWEAKLALRRQLDAQGRPVYAVRDWAAWVLEGG